MTENLSADEDVIKYRLVGALVWILLLLLFVPGWYADPVPQGVQSVSSDKGAEPIAITAYHLPEGVQPDTVKQEILVGARERHLQEIQQREQRLQESKVQTQMQPVVEKRSSDAASTNVDRQYMVRLITFFEIEKADQFVQGAKKHGYKVVLKEFNVSKNGKNQIVYQARTENYNSLDKALKAKQNLDKIFHLQGSRIIEVTQESKN
ncbi:SPOR domain-containing protein [Thiomicrorhabdus xiamenensis]|uniref:SPOR domain-containing protein n=1 Tax=Thiomicrorhabdus xiamenensis TaxID=2739063 RepID=A0A7D4SMR3_9GAMM|nr:hypothetical protein [Thiomicrorhabdus xiamenensis]QKI88861.1 hypothetical protein HQN79_04400 [Thiomicrorhabdus xiamenensis]